MNCIVAIHRCIIDLYPTCVSSPEMTTAQNNVATQVSSL